MDEARLLAAIASMGDVIRRSSDHDRDAEQQRVDAIRMVAERVKASLEEELGQLRTRIEACLLPVEPLRQRWNVFRLFDLEYEEIR